MLTMCFAMIKKKNKLDRGKVLQGEAYDTQKCGSAARSQPKKVNTILFSKQM